MATKTKKIYSVFYSTDKSFRAMVFGEASTKESMKETHRAVAAVYANTPDEAFTIMNGEHPTYRNPLLGKNQQGFLMMQGVGHTSMSVGDILMDHETKEYIQCQGIGWRNL